MSPSASSTHHLNINEEEEVRPTTSAAEFSALPTGGEGHPSSDLFPKSDPDNVRYHQEKLQTTGLKVRAATELLK
jgi:hypothetical protein